MARREARRAAFAASLRRAEEDTSDQELVRRATGGEPCAFEALVSRYESRVYSLARRLTGSAADAEEAFQDTFVRVHRGLPSFRGDAQFGTWLFRIATNSALMIRRRQARAKTEPLDAYLPRFDRQGRHARDAHPGRVFPADEMLDRQRTARAVRDGLQRLPPMYRAAFVLRDLEELATGEVARVLGIREATVRQRVHRARLLMRGYLSHLVGAKP